MTQEGEGMDDLATRIDAELRTYVESRRSAEEAEEVAKRFRQSADAQRDRVWELLEAAGVKTISHEMGKVTRMARLRAIVTDEEALNRWLTEHGVYDAMTKRVVRQANLNELASELIENGETLPEGLDTLTIRSIRFTPTR